MFAIKTALLMSNLAVCYFLTHMWLIGLHQWFSHTLGRDILDSAHIHSEKTAWRWVTGSGRAGCNLGMKCTYRWLDSTSPTELARMTSPCFQACPKTITTQSPLVLSIASSAGLNIMLLPGIAWLLICPKVSRPKRRQPHLLAIWYKVSGTWSQAYCIGIHKLGTPQTIWPWLPCGKRGCFHLRLMFLCIYSSLHSKG